MDVENTDEKAVLEDIAVQMPMIQNSSVQELKRYYRRAPEAVDADLSRH